MMARKKATPVSNRSAVSMDHDTLADPSPPTCAEMKAVIENVKQELILDEVSPLPVKSKLGKNKLKPVKAGAQFSTSGRLRKFVCKHSGCQYASAYSKDLKRHSRTHSGEQPYQCGTCERRFNRSDKLKDHEKLHTDIKSFSCEKCDFMAKTIRGFKKHMRSHSDEMPFGEECPKLTGECQYFVVNVNPDTVSLLSLPSDDQEGNGENEKNSWSPRGGSPLQYGSDHAGSIETTAKRPVLMPSNADRTNSGRLKRYACNYVNCRFLTAYKKDLTRHLRIHSGEQPFECGTCLKRFNRSDKLKTHERSHTGEITNPPRLKKFICNHADCQYASAYRKDLRRHMRVHSGEHPFQCKLCRKKFKRADTLRAHERSHMPGGDDVRDGTNLKRPVCDQHGIISSSAPFHPVALSPPRGTIGKPPDDVKQESLSLDASPISSNEITVKAFNGGRPKKYACNHIGCAFVCAYPKDLTRHSRVHSGEQPFECGTCKRKFNREDKLTLHQRADICDKPHCCAKCGFSTHSGGNFKKHLSIHSVESENLGSATLSCVKTEVDAEMDEQNSAPEEDPQVDSISLSGRSSSTCINKKILKPRQEGRSREKKKYTCDVADCHYASAYRKDLERHSRVHSGEKPFECTLCKRRFNRQDKLKLHERIHTGDKPYKCDKCNYASTEGSSLRIHSRIHSKEKPFRCHLCAYACRFSNQLASHIRCHSSGAPYSCEMCLCKFEARADLEKHELLHMGDKAYECASCNYKCTVKGNLKMHFSLKHHAKVNGSRSTSSACARKTLGQHMKHFPCPHPDCLYSGTSRQAIGLHILTHLKEKKPC